VPGYAQVLYRSVAPGIDVLVRREASGFAYDLHLAPGADLSAFVLTAEGAHAPVLREDGVLVLETASGPVEQRIGASWEIDDQGARVDVASAFTLAAPARGAVRLGFAAPGRDPGRAFVLDVVAGTSVEDGVEGALGRGEVGRAGSARDVDGGGLVERQGHDVVRRPPPEGS